jgi:two-component system CheB/CheR fusion protein
MSEANRERAERAARVVGIGASAGGLRALKALFGRLPPGGAAAYVVISHLAADRASSLPAILQAHTALPVAAVVDGETPERGRIYVIPPGADLILADRALRLVTTDGGGAGRAPIDRFFRSLADELGSEAAGVILSGTGVDGTLGLKRIKEAGGFTMVQSPDDAEYDGMPRSALATGLVDLVLPADKLAERLGAFAAGAIGPGLVEDDRHESLADTLRDILILVRIRTGHDFTSYKRATLLRRVSRRMQVCETGTIGDYHRFLRSHPAELTALLRDFLISVTSFFRDRQVFEALAADVMPRLFAGRDRSAQVRIWVTACATGEEAYSLAMLAAEEAARHADPPSVQIFATDIDEEALSEARAGRYPETIAADVSAARLDRFFIKEGGGYRVRQEIRELVLFSPHNVLRDPPFSRLDLVSCRNLLIYLNREAQDRVLGILHFAVRPDGVLVLGSSETAEAAARLFAPFDARHRLYVRRPTTSPVVVGAMFAGGRWPPGAAAPPPAGNDRPPSFGELHHKLVERYAPPSLLVNEELDIVHVSEHAGRFLGVGGGEPTRQLLRLVHPGLRLDLRAAIYAARQDERGAHRRAVRLDLDGKPTVVELVVRALDLPEASSGMLLVLFDEHAHGLTAPGREESAGDESRMEPVVRQLEDEVRTTRVQLRTTIEQYETTVEELKASNEELQAINEELRSASEELETSKEELQSVNEELTTLNHELKEKIEEVSRANSDLQNLMTSTDIGVLFLDLSLDIKRFTPRAQDLFNIIPTDIGRPLAHLTHRLECDDLTDDARLVLQDLRTVERDVRSTDGRRYLARLHPYRSVEDRIEGVVLTFLDVTELKRAEDALRVRDVMLQASEARFRLALRTAPVVMLNQDRELRYTWGYMMGGEIDFVGQTDAQLFVAAEAERLAALKRSVLESGAGRREEIVLTMGGRQHVYDFNIEPIRTADGIGGVSCAAVDVTASRLAERTLRDADRRKDELLATLAHELRDPLAPLQAALDLQKLAGDDLAEVERAREMMERQVSQIVHLVEDLLDVSRLTQGKLAIRCNPIAVSAVVDAALEATRQLAEKAGQRLTVEQPPEPAIVEGDLTRLTQVLTNLVNNAVKYTPPGGHIAIRVEAAPGAVRMVVADDGVGIAADMVPHVFDMFAQAREAVSLPQGGLGVGLALARRLVELHGGTIEAHSAGIDRGSRFVVTLPTATATAPTAPAAGPLVAPVAAGGEARAGAPRRVLVVDDNPDVSSTVCEVLELIGHRTRHASNGTTALAIAAEFQPEVVILDLGLVGASGFEVARALRASRGNSVLIVALTGWGQHGDLTRSREAGFDHHLVKPAGLETLRALVGDAGVGAR